jgi:hypothetical protein
MWKTFTTTTAEPQDLTYFPCLKAGENGKAAIFRTFPQQGFATDHKLNNRSFESAK